MNETKELETQLRSWKPRRPSPRLERRLFGRVAAPLCHPALLRVLVPAAACLILTVAMLNPPQHDRNVTINDPAALMAASLSNQSFASYLPGSFQCEANRLDSFRWTNGGGISSLMHFVSPRRAND